MNTNFINFVRTVSEVESNIGMSNNLPSMLEENIISILIFTEYILVDRIVNEHGDDKALSYNTIHACKEYLACWNEIFTIKIKYHHTYCTVFVYHRVTLRTN